MKIGIVGAGAMGSVYGGLFAAAGHAVWLVDIWREHIDAIRKDGLHVSGDQRRAHGAAVGHHATRPTRGRANSLCWQPKCATWKPPRARSVRWSTATP